ncbi:hypothetical protein MN116_008277 [Schistosoma mekongi]|uniref:Dynein light intermediate chain n=1 Tax=Schistosoma mekongi TaxID=38744 RepID=A0AAE1Z665_SCHME|nr:hypothetical protein MN116_008277 [Schistosoma mekongi]
MRDKPSDNKQNFWISLLDEVQLNRRNAYGTIESPDKPQLIIFGNESTDKKRLIECINSNKEIHCGIGLDYQFLDLHEDGSEDSLHMGVWCLDGHPQQSNLLKFALNKSNIWHTMGVICIDYTEPWSLINNLELWLQVIEQHINHLKIDSEEIDNLKLSIVYSFKMFTDPSAVKDDVTKCSINLRHQLSLQSQNIAKDQFENTKWSYSPLHPKPIGRNDGVSSSYSQQHSVQSDEFQLDGKDDQSEQKSNEQRSIKWLKNVITEGVMSKLLPIPIMVVITKTEITDTLEKDFGYTDEKFDFILYHLRKLCLEYGAALIYTSVKEAINTNTLVNYIKHRLFDLPLKNSAMLVDPKAIFIPAGWDSLHRLELFKKNLSSNLIDCNYNQIITKPSKFRRKTSCTTKTIGADTTPTEEINILQTVEDDQHFLRRMQTMLANMPMPTVTSSLPGSLSNTPSAGSTISSSQPRETSLLTESIPSNIPNQSKPGTTTDKEAVLSSFFNSLLSRKSLTETNPPKTIQSTTGMTSNRINPSTQDTDNK